VSRQENKQTRQNRTGDPGYRKIKSMEVQTEERKKVTNVNMMNANKVEQSDADI